LTQNERLDPDLSALAELWPDLPDRARKAILELAKAYRAGE
jgi:hypothetical protein